MWSATVKAGKLLMAPQTRARFHDFLATHEGARLSITHVIPERTLSELRMYRAWLGNVASHTGNDEEELHEYLLEKCAPRVVSKIAGPKGEVEVEQKKRTSGGHSLSMDVTEMSDFMAKCAELTGYPLPTPEELEAMGYVSNH